MTRLLAAAFHLLILASGAAAQTADPVAPEAHPYRTVAGDTLHAYVFAPNGALPNEAQEARSGILLFHGGGWSHGTPRWTFQSARRFAGHGMVALAVQYRLSKGTTTPIDALADVCAAFRWAREKAPALGVDSGRLAEYGVSAGGHLLAATATVGCPEAETEGGAAHSATPDAMLLWSPALDVARDGWFQRKLQGQAQAAAYSPAQHVRATTPRTSIVHGATDTLTPLSGAERYCEALRAQGAACELNVYEGVGHLLTRNLDHQESNFDPDPEAVADEAQRHLAFLRAHGIIGGE